MENVFCISGSAIRLGRLEAVFNAPPRYGKSLDWSGYTAHDAAAVLLRYLQRLPESMIPVDMYEAFQTPLKRWEDQRGYSPSPTDNDSRISDYQKEINNLGPLSRHVLLYFLEFLAVFARMSAVNKMTSARLATVFQPVILSSVKSGEGFVESAESRRLSMEVIIFLIENQDNFFINKASGNARMTGVRTLTLVT